ncbi:MFS transporter [Leucobacter sp. UT-8R-CII-1-4]|uniref:MFS transporter n=1 Tax=Leucobacter sp. UT-8R-CII-1-4 TaxID=3040075 RepID=UPI0024A7C8D1|nr:MFS transporter [Leucobacter sp. UT-8R-CII-1-4]MDI6022872.1 MFS transporter [Leucobacter sp. UT-8R-CII-1-4]
MNAQTPLENATIVRWIRAILIIFFLMGFGFGTWLSRLPSLRDALDASTLQMSIYGLCLAAGSLTGMVLSARAVERFGPRRMMGFTIAVQVIALPCTVIFMVGGLMPLGILALYVYGLCFSAADVAMNVSGANAERVFHKPRLPLMHAFYSIGSMAAMAIGASAELFKVDLAPHFIGVALLIGVTGFLALKLVPMNEDALRAPNVSTPLITTGPIPIIESGAGDEFATQTGSIPVVPAGSTDASSGTGAAAASPKRRYSPWRDPRVLLVGLITLSAGLVEGAPADWLPLALVDGRGVSNEFGALMLGLFYGAVVSARLAGSALLMRFSRVLVLRASLTLAAIGILIVVLVPYTPATVIGTIVWGLGAGVCWPITISAAADRHETAARDVAAVSAIGYTSMLLGPMAFGVLGEAIGLLSSFLVLPVFVVLALIFAGVTREPDKA